MNERIKKVVLLILIILFYVAIAYLSYMKQQYIQCGAFLALGTIVTFIIYLMMFNKKNRVLEHFMKLF